MYAPYPRKVEYWICSDDRTFTTEKQAIEHENFISKAQSATFTNSSKDQATGYELYQ